LIADLKKYEELVNNKGVFDGNRVMYRGTYREISSVRSRRGKGVKVKVYDDRIVIHTSGGRDTSKALKDWITAKTEKFVTRKAHVYAEKLGVSFKDLRVKEMKKWGLYTKKGELVFNWRLVALPEKLAEYVVLHELAHLSQFNHSSRFQAMLASICPDFKERQNELRDIYIGSG
jgi:hypothetical protein